MAVKTLPLAIELVVYAGTTLHREYRWLPDGNAALDFTGWSAVMLIGPYSEPALFQLDTATNGGIELTADGRVIIELAATATMGLQDIPNLAYQVDLTDPDGYVLRFLHGRVTVSRDVEPKP